MTKAHYKITKTLTEIKMVNKKEKPFQNIHLNSLLITMVFS